MELTLDATLAHLTSPASRRMPFRLPFRRGNAVVHGLSIRQIGDVCDRHEAVRDGVWHLFGLSNSSDYKRTDADARALLDLVMTSLGTRSPVALFRITRLSTDEFVDLVEAMVRLTVPHMPEPLFEPKGKATPPKEPEGPWDDPAVVLRKLAVKLKPPEGLLDWTPGRLLFVASTLGEHDAASARIKVANDAHAARIARAKDESFRQAIAELQRG